MRVVLIDVNAKGSSTGNIVYAQKQGLEKRGDIALLCYARGERLEESGIYKFGLRIETAIHALLTRFTGYTDCFSPFSTWRLIRKIKAFAPDIVHIHELHSYFLNRRMFWRFLKKQQYKILWSLHCDIAFTGRCGLALDCKRYQSGCGGCPHLANYPKTLFWDRSAPMWRRKKALYGEGLSLRFTTPSAWLKERLAGSFLGHYPCSVVANGLAPVEAVEENYLHKKFGIEGAIVLAVVPSFYDPNKGVGYFIELAKQYEDRGLSFVIVSRDYKGEVQIAKNLYALVNPGRVKIYAAYADSKVFLLLSRFETFSMTCVEALMAGTPVLGFEAGAPERIFAKPYADFVPYGDLPALAQKLETLLESPQDRAEIQAYALANFSEEAMLAGYLAEYEKDYGAGHAK